MSEVLGELLERQMRSKPDYEYIGIGLYVEGIIKLLNMRPRFLGRGPKELPLFLPHNLKVKIYHSFTSNRSVLFLPVVKELLTILFIAVSPLHLVTGQFAMPSP